jgi:phage-related minor tail protein
MAHSVSQSVHSAPRTMDSRMATRRRRLEQLVVGIGAAASSDLDAVEEELEAALAEQHAVTKRVAALTKQKDELLQKPTPMEAYSFDKDGYIGTIGYRCQTPRSVGHRGVFR